MTVQRIVSSFLPSTFLLFAFVAMVSGTLPDPRRLHAAPLPSQIIVDPANPSWFRHHQGGPFFLCGPGDPEGFLYRGSHNPDGTRNGDQMALIHKLAGTGANSIYLMAVRSHGGDGDSTQNPFIDHDPAQGVNPAVLAQWEEWFTEMDRHGIVIFFFLYDDSTKVWDTGDTVGAAERTFLQTLVNAFEHHTHLIWVIAEEYQEAFTPARVSNIAAVIRAADDHAHPIAVHKLSGLAFSEFADDPCIDQFAIQYNTSSAAALHRGMVAAWNEARGRYNLNMSEAANHGTGATARRKNWAIAMGGAYVMVLGWDIASTAVKDLEDCGRLVNFMERTDFTRMAPHDELKFGGTEYVLAFPGQSYIAYAGNLAGRIGLKNMSAGTYDFRWLDIVTGTIVKQRGIAIQAGDRTWPTPPTIGNELAVYIRRSQTSDVAPPAPPSGLAVMHGATP